MKVSELLSFTLLIGVSALIVKRKRRHGVFGTGIAPRRSGPSRVQILKSLVMGLEGNQHLRTKMKAEARRVPRKFGVRPIFEDHEVYGAWFTLTPTLRMDPEKFYNFMRMTVESFDKLLAIVGPFLRKKSFKAISPGERLCITLRYLATGNSFVDLSYLFRVSDECISTIVFETTNVIWHALQDVVMKPMTEEGWLRVAAEFQAMWQFPHCLGAIDGKHVRIRAFPHSGSQNFNYKDFHSLILMAVCDAKYRFISIDFGASGSRGDGNVFYFSPFATMMRKGMLDIPPPCPADGFKQDVPFVFVGDAAFATNENLNHPIKGKHLPDEEKLFNYRLSRARRCIENAFGILVARFRILLTAINASKAQVKSIVKACTVLHNLHLLDEDSIPPKNKRYNPEGYVDYIDRNGNVKAGRWRKDKKKGFSLFSRLKNEVCIVKGLDKKDNKTLSGQAVVEMFIEHFVDNPVPWQWRSANLI